MKKSKKSQIGTRVIAKKITSETNSDFEYNSNILIGDAGITGLVHLTRGFSKVKRETKDFPSEYIKIMEDRLFFFSETSKSPHHYLPTTKNGRKI